MKYFSEKHEREDCGAKYSCGQCSNHWCIEHPDFSREAVAIQEIIDRKRQEWKEDADA